MKKVLVYGLKDVYGGLEKYLLVMQEHLQTEVSFTYLVEGNECMHQDRIVALGGEIVYLKPRHPLKAHIQELNSLLKKLAGEYGTIYVNVTGISFDIAVIVLSRINGYNVIVHSHNAMMEPIKHPFYRILHKTLETLAIWILSHLKVRRLAVSDRAAAYLFQKKDIALVPPGVAVSSFKYNEQGRNRVRADIQIDNGKLYGFVGRLVEGKNPRMVIDIFARILCQEPEAHLLMLGDGPLREELESYTVACGLSDRVHFMGEKSKLSDYYSAMDCLILPSMSEGLSLVAIEAQAAGVPFVCSEGRFPQVIALTEMIRFVPLEDSVEQWASVCIEHSSQFLSRSRVEWNECIERSPFEIKNAVQELREALLR